MGLPMFSNFDFLHGQVLVGLLISLACIAVHAVVMALVRWGAFRTSRAVVAASTSVRLVLVMMATVSILMMAHIAEFTIWGLSYVALHTIKDQSEAFYFAFVNYTTLGYGDIIPVARWRLLGPMSPMNGILLFGWPTAVIYDVLRTVAQLIPLKSAAGALSP
jgi:hypothetical protein